MSQGDCWAQLVCTSEEDGLVIPISSDVFCIGRAKVCDLSMPDNKLISGKHCCLRKIGQNNTVWLEDTSTNGTWLNGVKVGKGQKQRLCHGDEITIVYQHGGRSDENIVYRFEDFAVVEAENENLDQTQALDTDENTEDYHCEDQEEKDVSRKRKNTNTPEDETEAPAAKKQVMEDEKVNKCEEKQEKADKKKEHKSDKEVEGEKLEETANSDDAAESAAKLVDDEEMKKGEDTEVKAKTTGDGGGGGGEQEDKTDDIWETLICSICQDILHNCISLQPCMHSFCAACYSGWKKHSRRCPQCRKTARQAGHNYIVNSLVDAYLKQHPDKRRSKEELEEMDAQNKIPINQQFSYDGDEDDNEDYDPDIDEEEENSFENYVPPPPPPCRQCAHYVQPLNRAVISVVSSLIQSDVASSSGTTVGAAASASNTGASLSSSTNQKTRVATGGVVVTMPTPPQFQCDPQHPVHTMCFCCMELMPDRRGDRAQNPDIIPPLQCSVCSQLFCQMYWGCWKQNCYGCLNKFREMKFSEKVLDNIVNGNTYESTMFKNILQGKGTTSIAAVLKQCLDKLTTGEFSTPETQRHNLTADSPICYMCGLKVFQQLGYQLRAAIPTTDLPTSVRARPDCHWGKNCRTQYNKPRHAAQFNHICEQTRF